LDIYVDWIGSPDVLDKWKGLISNDSGTILRAFS